MKLNPNNDVYPGDLSILNVRKQQWAKGEERSKVYNICAVVILIAGLRCCCYSDCRSYLHDHSQQ